MKTEKGGYFHGMRTGRIVCIVGEGCYFHVSMVRVGMRVCGSFHTYNALNFFPTGTCSRRGLHSETIQHNKRQHIISAVVQDK